MNKKAISFIYLALCILLWASIPVASKKILKELDNFQMLFYSTVLSLTAITVILAFVLLKERVTVRKIAAVLIGFLGIVVIVTKGRILSVDLTNIYGDTHIISSALYVTPFLSLLYIALFLDEKILTSSLVGLIIVVFGIAVQLSEKPLTPNP